MATSPLPSNMNGTGISNMEFLNRVSLYRQFDERRHEELERFAREYQELHTAVANLKADLDDERTARRTWRQRAEMSDALLARNQFALVLVDGDGYHFNRSLYSNESGGAQAAHVLCTEVQQYLKANGETNEDMEVMAIVYFNKQVPSKALLDADIIQNPYQFNEFFWSFTSSRSLFQVVDCGPGKERADAKLRDTYRFYANNAHCKYIFLACCHDSGYIAELDKYRHDPIARPKTRLVSHGNTANAFFNLDLPFARFALAFDMEPIHKVQKFVSPQTYVPRVPDGQMADDTSSQTSLDTYSNGARIPTPSWEHVNHIDNTTITPVISPPANTWSKVTANAAKFPIRSSTTSSLSGSAQRFELTKFTVSKTVTGDRDNGIPVNRIGQRIDKKIQTPSPAELDRFGKRIEEQKLCNTHHLTSTGCFAYKCGYDHSPIDAVLKHSLRYKARAIPCGTGSKCRKAECFYGHQCPWGNDMCTNPKCNFYKNGLHEIDDLEIAKYVPAVN